jgi:adenosine deaminase
MPADAAPLRSLPKVELHLHLEGAIPLKALWALVEKYGAQGEVSSVEELRERFQFRDFDHFIQLFRWKNGFLREYEDFTFIARAVAGELARQNVRYAEMFYSPGHFEAKGLTLQRITEAIRAGLDAHATQVTVNLVPDLIRDFGPAQGRRWLYQLAEVKDRGVVGIGIGGSEGKFPPHPYEAVYEEARRLGLRTSAHAGEAAGAESVWGAVLALKVDRIGHGTRAGEDPALLDYLAEREIPLEVCPVSNLRTGVVGSMAEHPVRAYFDRGLTLTVNSDDPAMFHTSLEGEFRALMDTFGFTLEEIRRLTANAIRAAWCGDGIKARLALELKAWAQAAGLGC